MTTPGALAATDQWLAAVAEVERFANRYLGLMEDERHELLAIRMMGPLRSLALAAGKDVPTEMDGRLLVLWSNGEVQELKPGCTLPADVKAPARLGRQGNCDRCDGAAELTAAYLLPASPSLFGVVVCAGCAIEVDARFTVPWVTREK